MIGHHISSVMQSSGIAKASDAWGKRRFGRGPPPNKNACHKNQKSLFKGSRSSSELFSDLGANSSTRESTQRQVNQFARQGAEFLKWERPLKIQIIHPPGRLKTLNEIHSPDQGIKLTIRSKILAKDSLGSFVPKEGFKPGKPNLHCSSPAISPLPVMAFQLLRQRNQFIKQGIHPKVGGLLC